MATRKSAITAEVYSLEHTPDIKMNRAQRMAQFLLQAAKDHPQMFFKKAHLLRIANLDPSLPRGEKQLKEFNGIKTAAKLILERDHKCTIHSERASGYRATHGDEDMAKTQLRIHNARLVAQHTRTTRIATAIEPRNIHNAAIREEVANARRALTNIGGQLGSLTLPQLKAKLPEENRT